MIRVVIADDEELSRRALEQMLARHDDVAIVGVARNGAEARQAIETLRPDVALLDIRMPLESGLEVAFATGNGDTLIVFVTAFDAFALPAFDAGAADYLTKPIVEARFDAMLVRVRARIAAREHGNAEARYLHQLVARVGMTDVVIPVPEIVYIQASDVYAMVITGAGRWLVRISLQELERSLDPALFVRIHRSYLVRHDRIQSVKRSRDGTLHVALPGDVILPVSRRQRAAVRELLRTG